MLLIVRATRICCRTTWPQARFEAAMPDQERRGDDLIAFGTHRDPDGVIVGERIGQRAEAADPIEHRSAAARWWRHSKAAPNRD